MGSSAISSETLRRLCVDSILLDKSVGNALRREVDHVLSGQSDHESGSLELEPDALPLPSESPVDDRLSCQKDTPRRLDKRAADKLRRQKKRSEARAKQPWMPRPSLLKKFPKPEGVVTDFRAETLPAAKGAFVSQRQVCKAKEECTLDGLLASGFKLLEWDGVSPIAIVDKENRVISVLAGRPRSHEWSGVQARMSALLEDAPKYLTSIHPERRGQFVSLSAGVLYGGGQTVPGNLALSPSEASVIKTFVEDQSFVRAAGFMCSVFAFYAPKLYQEYSAHLTPLFHRYPHFKKPFPKSVFPTCTFNCGPSVVTSEHVDSTNVPFGFCAIFACGSYDPRKGGHLILFDLNLVVEFPPGSTILVPSGTLRHGNAPIQVHETRQLFTQYCPGGLFHWVEYGFKPVKSSSAEMRRRFEETHDERCKRAVGLFSSIDELERDRQEVFNLRTSA